MSGIKGKVRKPSDFQRETGFFEGQVVAINPDREQLEKLLETTIEKDPEYIGEEDGVKKAQIVFWIRDEKTKKVKDLKFFIRDSDREKAKPKDGASEEEKRSFVKKKQYINEIGTTSWADKEENLQDWFTQRDYRVAKEGEEELYAFLQKWLGKLDFKDKDALLSFDFRKLLRGNVSELREQINGEYNDSVVFLKIVRKVEKDGEDQYYEQIYNREFLPGYVMKQIKLKKIDGNFIEAAEMQQKTDRKKLSALQRFVLSVTDRQYGIRDFYTLGELEIFDPAKATGVAVERTVNDDDLSY
jgi:hypothetical protein